MDQLRSLLTMPPAMVDEFRSIDRKRRDAQKRQAEYLAGADERRAAAEAKRARKRAKNLALAAR